MSYIKWGCIQPLTGGMYIGAEKAIGHAADWVISFPGLADVKRNKDGEITTAGNEYHFLSWCKKNDRLPKYKLFNRAPFDKNLDLNVELIDDTVWSTGDIDMANTDIVVSVPVCSGLSQATAGATIETKYARNCNMVWNTKYALGVVRPKVFIFENAPGLFGDSGKYVRDMLDDIAIEYGYSIIYYKTDTRLHDNCQRRPRTFIVFVNDRNGETGAPEMQYENVTTTIDEYMSRIPDGCSQQTSLELTGCGKILYDYIKYHYGADYRKVAKCWLAKNIIDDDLYDDMYAFANGRYPQADYDKLVKMFDHIHDKVSQGKGYYVLLPALTSDDCIPACMFKTIPGLIHYKEDRLYTIREWLHIMGMPFDFEMYGDIEQNYPKIGQNVPVRTAQWITHEAVRIVENWDVIDRTGAQIAYYDNVKQKKIENKWIILNGAASSH